MTEKKITEMTTKELWADLNAAGTPSGPAPLKECCRVVRLLRDTGLKAMWVFYQDRKVEAAKLNYCPECGRRLA